MHDCHTNGRTAGSASGRHFQAEDIAFLDRIPAGELLKDLSGFRFRFQERRFNQKWEVGLARSLLYRPVTTISGLFPTWLLVPVFRPCLMISAENDAISGVAFVRRLVVKPSGKSENDFVISSGPGFKLDKTPDGWSIKPIEKRPVKLSGELLRKRGWQFAVLPPLQPA